MNDSIISPQDSLPVPKQDSKREVLVRMYDCGFGDTFLMRIPTPDGKWLKVLFDCGSIKHGALQLEEVVHQVIEDCRDGPGEPARIDVIVATHRHRDHIAGFEKSEWDQVEVKEVWMPWTEKPEDVQALGIRGNQLRLAQALVSGTETQLAACSDPEAKNRLNAAHEIALNAMTNEGAMLRLYQGFACGPKRKYLVLNEDLSNPIITEVLPGVAFYVLGPSKDPATIREMEPPIGQNYLRMFGSGGEADTERTVYPFGKDWVITPNHYAEDYSALDSFLPSDDRDSIQGAASLGLEYGAAAALDGALNGTSLMLLFHIGKACLLFPGDAQWGTWRLALKNPESRRLLDSVNFYKVGHHASFNATPKDFVEKCLKNDFYAMISTNHMGSYPQVPKKELVEALAEKTKKLARTDKLAEAPKEWFTFVREGVVEAHIPI